MSGHTFVGVGPKGHRREDWAFHEKVCQALERDPSVEASGIEVLVEGTEVFLSGTVFSVADRARAEQVAKDAGAHRVVNRLELFGSGPNNASNLNTDSTISGAVDATNNGDYDPMS